MRIRQDENAAFVGIPHLKKSRVVSTYSSYGGPNTFWNRWCYGHPYGCRNVVTRPVLTIHVVAADAAASATGLHSYIASS